MNRYQLIPPGKMELLEVLYMVAMLPYHIFHVLTYGKYLNDKGKRKTYQNVALILFVFTILGLFIGGLTVLILHFAS